MFVAEHLYLSSTSGTATEFSPAVAMAGHNTVDIQLWLFSITGSTTVNAYIEVSDDGQYWQDWSNPSTPTAVATYTSAPGHTFGPSSITQITKRFVRFRYTIAGTSAGAIISARLKPTTAYFAY